MSDHSLRCLNTETKTNNLRKITMAFRRYSGFMLVYLLISVIPACSYSQSIEVRVRLDTNIFQLGDLVNMNIEVEKPLGSQVTFPEFADTLTADIEIIEKSKLDSSLLKDNKVLLKQNLKLTVYDTGLFLIPPIVFIYHSGNYTDSVLSPPDLFLVLSFPVDKTNTIRDIKGIYKVPIGFREIYPFILVFLGIIIIILLIWYIIKKKKQNEPIIFRAKPMDPPDVIALRELDRLKAEKLWQQGKVKEYYSGISDILRVYIEGRFNITAPEQTSDEILTNIREAIHNNADYNRLKSLLQLADLVKFAKANPEPDENVEQFENACQFVLNTRHQQYADAVSSAISNDSEKEKAEN